ncbi:MAG: hypothetical protein Q8R76_09565 [Candidatus Omnitrophota bacterium]|nr:hypothetical protein [Candidatus Omnitrophota bacterium]
MNLRNILLTTALGLAGCVALFGWDIHAPGLLSNHFYETVQPAPARIALYIPKEVMTYVSQERGGRLADPQTYHVGEAITPMLIEAFQRAFDEFLYMEAEPTQAIMKRYAIAHVAAIRIKDFGNQVTLKGQAVTLLTEVELYDSELEFVARLEARGTSDAQKVFAKKGGPEVNLNAAIENNVIAIVQHLQDTLGV